MQSWNKKMWWALVIPCAFMALTACSSSNSSDDASSAAAATEATESTDATEVAAAANSKLSAEEMLEQADAEALGNPFFYGRAIYLRGEMNDYSVQRPYRLRQFEDKVYCTIAPLRSDWAPYRFKFADAQWTTGTNFGFAVPPAVMREGSGKAQLNPNSRFEELRYEPTVDGLYRFCIEYNEQNVPYATVTRLEDGKLTTMDELIKREVSQAVATPATVANTTTTTAATTTTTANTETAE